MAKAIITPLENEIKVPKHDYSIKIDDERIGYYSKPSTESLFDAIMEISACKEEDRKKMIYQTSIKFLLSNYVGGYNIYTQATNAEKAVALVQVSSLVFDFNMNIELKKNI